MKVSIRSVGPEEAQKYLASQRRNRRLRPGHVKQLASAMERGEWHENGEAIKLDKNGHLCDGQHRLAAVMESGVTLRMVVVEGLVPEAQETIDIGRHRNMSDILSLRGEVNTAVLGATLSTLYRIRTKTIQAQGGVMKPTPQQLLKLLEDEPEIRNFLQRGRTVSRRVPITASLAAAYWYEFHSIDPDDANDFFTKLTNGLNLEEGDPIFALRRFLERERQSPRSLPRYRIAGVLVKAWNLYRNGATDIRALSFRAGGASAEAFPEIDGLAEVDEPVRGDERAKVGAQPERRKGKSSNQGRPVHRNGAVVTMPAKRAAVNVRG